MPRTVNDVMREMNDLIRRAQRQNLRIKRFHMPSPDMTLLKSLPWDRIAPVVRPSSNPLHKGSVGIYAGIEFVENNSHRGKIWLETETT